ncbi:MAG: glycosyltransferase family 39 protein [Chloroflexota bacterium]
MMHLAKLKWPVPAWSSDKPPARQWILLILIGVFLLMTGLSTSAMRTESLWYDEVWSTIFAGGAQYGPIPIGETINRVVAEKSERNPPGYYILLNLWGRVVGWSEFAGRVLSLLVGLLAVAWTYRLGYALAPPQTRTSRIVVGLSAAIALALSAFFIEYVHELRAYDLAVMLTAFTVWAYWHLVTLKREPGWLSQIGFVLGVTAMLYTHYTTVFVLVVLGLYHLLCVPKNRRWWRVVVLVIISGLAFVPWAQTLLHATANAVETFRTVSLNAGQIFETLAIVFSNQSVALLALLIVLALGVRGRSAGAIWFLAIGVFLLAIVANVFFPVILHIRYVLVLWPLLALVVGLGVERLSRLGISPVWVLVIWLVAGVWYSLDPAYYSAHHNPRLPWRSFKAELQTHGQPDDVVAFHAPVAVWFQGPELTHYMYGLPMRYSLMEDIPGKPDDYFQQAQHWLADAPRVWVGVDKTTPPTFRLPEFERVLTADYSHCRTVFDTAEMSFDLYAHHLTNPALRFGDSGNAGSGIGISLLEPLKVEADGTLSVLLATSLADNVLRDTYSIGLHVVDAAGTLKAQSDFGLPNEVQACRPSTVLINRLSPGQYHLLITVYDWRTGKPLPALIVASGTHGERLELGTFALPTP